MRWYILFHLKVLTLMHTTKGMIELITYLLKEQHVILILTGKISKPCNRGKIWSMEGTTI